MSDSINRPFYTQIQKKIKSLLEIYFSIFMKSQSIIFHLFSVWFSSVSVKKHLKIIWTQLPEKWQMLLLCSRNTHLFLTCTEDYVTVRECTAEKTTTSYKQTSTEFWASHSHFTSPPRPIWLPQQSLTTNPDWHSPCHHQHYLSVGQGIQDTKHELRFEWLEN